MSACETCGVDLVRHPGSGRPPRFCDAHKSRRYRYVAKGREKPARRALVERAIPILSAAGWTLADIAALAGYKQAASIANLGAGESRDSSMRVARMVQMYRSGMTLGEIGQEFNITRERVRQLISKAGISRAEGGISARKVSSQVAYQDEVKRSRDARAQTLFGCDYETAVQLNGGSSSFRVAHTRAAAYLRQKRSAVQNRDIEWLLTFPEWCRIWDESGKWSLRGRGRGAYCMSRKRDVGPYSIENVRIISNEQNIAEGWDVTPYNQRVTPDEDLRATQRQVFALRQSGKSHKEIAEELGITPKMSLQFCVVGKRLAAREAA